jgi:acetylornithine deacetylase/succinyl-diaminopimelate desuccinylase-like protein
MLMLELKRRNVPLDRDVIFLAESGEEGTTAVGIDFMTREHRSEIDAEYCFAEGGTVLRSGGRVRFAGIQTLEKNPRAIELTATGPAGHGSVPLEGNALVHLSKAVAAVSAWKPPIRLNETTREYFRRLAALASGEDAARYRSVLVPDSPDAQRADAYFQANEPRYASMLRTSISPTIIQGGYRVNVIPSEAKATLDVRMVPVEDPDAFLDAIRGVINDPAVKVAYVARSERPKGPAARVDSEAFKALETVVAMTYDTVAVPIMGTGATDMSQVRAAGTQCYGIGPASDVEDVGKGFGAHSDQERILESELYRFVRYSWEAVVGMARSR